MLEGVLRDDPSIAYAMSVNAVRLTLLKRSLTEPSPIRLDSSWHCELFTLLESCRLRDVSILVSYGLTAREHLNSGGLFSIAIKVLPLDASNSR